VQAPLHHAQYGYDVCQMIRLKQIPSKMKTFIAVILQWTMLNGSPVDYWSENFDEGIPFDINLGSSAEKEPQGATLFWRCGSCSDGSSSKPDIQNKQIF
jgi:hypothetical protein